MLKYLKDIRNLIAFYQFHFWFSKPEYSFLIFSKIWVLVPYKPFLIAQYCVLASRLSSAIVEWNSLVIFAYLCVLCTWKGKSLPKICLWSCLHSGVQPYSVVSIIRHVSIISTVWKKLQMTLLNVQYDLMLKRSYFLIYVLFTS